MDGSNEFLRARLAAAHRLIDELRADADRLRAERDAARALVFRIGDRLLVAARVLGRPAERKDMRNR